MRVRRWQLGVALQGKQNGSLSTRPSLWKHGHIFTWLQLGHGTPLQSLLAEPQDVLCSSTPNTGSCLGTREPGLDESRLCPVSCAYRLRSHTLKPSKAPGFAQLPSEAGSGLVFRWVDSSHWCSPSSREGEGRGRWMGVYAAVLTEIVT